MDKKNKYIFIVFLFLIIFGMIIALQFEIKKFMNEYENCKDDFRVIEQCGCLPKEGDYSYFEKDFKSNLNSYEIGGKE